MCFCFILATVLQCGPNQLSKSDKGESEGRGDNSEQMSSSETECCIQAVENSIVSGRNKRHSHTGHDNCENYISEQIIDSVSHQDGCELQNESISSEVFESLISSSRSNKSNTDFKIAPFHRFSYSQSHTHSTKLSCNDVPNIENGDDGQLDEGCMDSFENDKADDGHVTDKHTKKQANDMGEEGLLRLCKELLDFLSDIILDFPESSLDSLLTQVSIPTNTDTHTSSS